MNNTYRKYLSMVIIGLTTILSCSFAFAYTDGQQQYGCQCVIPNQQTVVFFSWSTKDACENQCNQYTAQNQGYSNCSSVSCTCMQWDATQQNWHNCPH